MDGELAERIRAAIHKAQQIVPRPSVAPPAPQLRVKGSDTPQWRSVAELGLSEAALPNMIPSAEWRARLDAVRSGEGPPALPADSVRPPYATLAPLPAMPGPEGMGTLRAADGSLSRRTFLVNVLTCDRPGALRRLLLSLGQSVYGGDTGACEHAAGT
jgi:hypothetical protein